MGDKQKRNFDFTVKWFDSRGRNLGFKMSLLTKKGFPFSVLFIITSL